MAFLSWHERYSVGHDELDAQHKGLFERVNHFNDLLQTGLAPDARRVMEDLIDATIAHFRFEEDLMNQAGFPKSSDHKKMHGELIKQVRDLQVQLRVGGHASTAGIARFLADWLTYHIMREDMEYKPFLKR